MGLLKQGIPDRKHLVCGVLVQFKLRALQVRFMGGLLASFKRMIPARSCLVQSCRWTSESGVLVYLRVQ